MERGLVLELLELVWGLMDGSLGALLELLDSRGASLATLAVSSVQPHAVCMGEAQSSCLALSKSDLLTSSDLISFSLGLVFDHFGRGILRLPLQRSVRAQRQVDIVFM